MNKQTFASARGDAAINFAFVAALRTVIVVKLPVIPVLFLFLFGEDGVKEGGRKNERDQSRGSY